ncbi:MAG: hypothetical protein WCF85_20130, partial [Rhodospirillaceae bacterium]
DAVQWIKSDSALAGLQSTTANEGMTLIARQVARRMIHGAVSDAAHASIMPLLAGGAATSVETLISPVLGITALGIGFGAEYGTIKLRQVIEGERLTGVAESVLESLQENQNRALSDAVSRRITGWFGE